MADVGHEADAPEVDADERHAVAHQLARRGEQAAVAADDHREVGSGVALGEHLAAAPLEESAHLAQGLVAFRAAQLADQRDAAESRLGSGRGHAHECTMNRCSTSARKSSLRP
jgi:hypothetical protein